MIFRKLAQLLRKLNMFSMLILLAIILPIICLHTAMSRTFWVTAETFLTCTNGNTCRCLFLAAPIPLIPTISLFLCIHSYMAKGTTQNNSVFSKRPRNDMPFLFPFVFIILLTYWKIVIPAERQEFSVTEPHRLIPVTLWVLNPVYVARWPTPTTQSSGLCGVVYSLPTWVSFSITALPMMFMALKSLFPAHTSPESSFTYSYI